MLMKIGLLLVAIVVVLTLFKKFSGTQRKKEEVEESAVEMKQDPVCGTFVEETTKYKVKYYDKIYYFCSEECKRKFIEQKQAENI